MGYRQKMWKQQADADQHNNIFLTHNFAHLQRFIPLPLGCNHI